MSHLSPDQIESFRKRLADELESLEQEIKKLEAKPDMGDEPGPEDEIDEATEYYNQQAQVHDLRERLGKIESALIRIEKGTYGICEMTGKQIPLEALEVNPYLAVHPDYAKEHHNHS